MSDRGTLRCLMIMRAFVLLALLPFTALGCSEGDPAPLQATGAGGSAATSTVATSGSGGTSSTASTTGGGGSAGAGGGEPVGTPTIVAVGYGGRRMRSTDLGVTWTDLLEDAADGGDDQNLLRATVYAEGVFVAAGWRIHVSPDGASWTEHTVDGQQWMGGLAHGSGTFVGAGGCGQSLVSDDGIAWAAGANVTPDECRHVRSLAFGNGVFVAAGDGGFTSTSSDGQSWTALDENGVRRVRFRDGTFIGEGEDVHLVSTNGVTWSQGTGEPNTADYGHGYFFRGPWKGKVERSVDGADWEETFNDDGNALTAFSFGYVE